MKRSEFNQTVIEPTMATLMEINTRKGNDYAGDEDALANFKRQAENLGLTPEQVWAVYWAKHVDAVMTYCKRGQVESEPIEGRLHDIMVYCLLLLGLIKEKQ